MIFILLTLVEGTTITETDLAKYVAAKRIELSRACRAYNKKACIEKERLELILQEAYLHKLNGESND